MLTVLFTWSITMEQPRVRVVVIESESTGTVRGAWFSFADKDAITTAFAATSATIIEVEQVKLDQVDADFPAGKLPTTGRPTLPPIKRAVYERLSILAMPARATGPARPAPDTQPGDPANAIRVGTVVLASTSRDEGWWEAVVVKLEQNGGTLRLRWKDYPSDPEFTKPLMRVVIPPANGLR